jgi:hypothetical protein
VGLKLSGTQWLLAYADDMNLLRDNIETVKINTGTLNDAGKEVGLEVNIKKANYMLVCYHQDAGQDQDIQIANRTLEHVYSPYIWG